MGCIGRSPGVQITPAQVKASPGAISPATTSAPSRPATLALEEPPVIGSVVRSHSPNRASSPSSKSATSAASRAPSSAPSPVERWHDAVGQPTLAEID